MVAPEIAPPELAPDIERRSRLIPRYRVLLHNDDFNEMGYVVRALQKSVPSLSREAAEAIMLEAHEQGVATVIVCLLELAELYRDRLQSFKLTSMIERE